MVSVSRSRPAEGPAVPGDDGIGAVERGADRDCAGTGRQRQGSRTDRERIDALVDVEANRRVDAESPAPVGGATLEMTGATDRSHTGIEIDAGAGKRRVLQVAQARWSCERSCSCLPAKGSADREADDSIVAPKFTGFRRAAGSTAFTDVEIRRGHRRGRQWLAELDVDHRIGRVRVRVERRAAPHDRRWLRRRIRRHGERPAVIEERVPEWIRRPRSVTKTWTSAPGASVLAGSNWTGCPRLTPVRAPSTESRRSATDRRRSGTVDESSALLTNRVTFASRR